MDISPAVQSPAKGDPITAAWAAQVAAAVNSSATALKGDESVQTPFGTAEQPRVPPALGVQKYPQPFDCVIYNDSGTDKVAMFLPSGSPSYVWIGSTPLSPAAGQSVGNATSGWADVETAQNSARYIYLAVHADGNGDPDGWKLYPTGTPDTPPAWAVAGMPMVLLAVYDASAAHFAPSGKVGMNQYRHGSIAIGTGDEVVLDTDAATGDPPGESLNRFVAPEPQPGETPPPDGDGQIQLRQFHDTTDVETVQAIGDTGGGTTPANLQTLFRKVGQGTADVRPKLVYADASTGPFWVQGADDSVNFGTALKLGDSSIGYIIISVTQ